MNELEIIDFHGTRLPVVEVKGQPRVCLHRAFSAIGLDADRQVRNLRQRPWADIQPTAVTAVYAGQEHVKNMITSDVRTFLMALATIPVTRVAEHVRPILVAFQCEVARVIEKHFMRKRGEDLTNPHTFT